MIIKTAPTLTYKIWMAGNYANAEKICHEYCKRGMCVSIAPTNYIYTGGEESGFCVTLINYARFPSTNVDLGLKAEQLANMLMAGLNQNSFSIEGPSHTYFYSNR